MKLKKLLIIILFISAASLVSPLLIFSKMGVGVGTGKIQIDKVLKPGMVYKFPSFVVFNTGDEPSYYEVSLAYKTGQEELRPSEEWLKMSPERFYLEPGGSQNVDVKLVLPVKVRPGDYFAYLQGKPVDDVETSGTSVGIAAAAKLYFTVAPANVLGAIYYRGLNFWQEYYPWTAVVSGVIGGILLIITLKKLLGIEINVQLGKNKKKKNNNE